MPRQPSPPPAAGGFKFFVKRGDVAEVVTVSEPSLGDSLTHLLERLNRAMAHVHVHASDRIWIRDRDFDAEVLLTSVAQLEASGRPSSTGGVLFQLTAQPESHHPQTTPGRAGGSDEAMQRQGTLLPPYLEGMHRSHTALEPERNVPWAPVLHAAPNDNVPLRIFLVRHGESEANVDKSVYRTKPDHAIRLTEKGRESARGTGTYLRRFFKSTFGSKKQVGHHIRMFISPYARTRETAEGIIRSLNDCEDQWVDSVRESTLLVEQDWGTHEGEGLIAQQKYREEIERNQIKSLHDGRFWARYPNGESCFDVCHRVSAFFPDILMASKTATSERRPVKTAIIVSHGVTVRAFLAMWCRYSPEWFAHSSNPPNCSVQLLEDQWDRGYVFGGWNRDTPIGEPVNVCDLARKEDPQHARWNMFLNQAAGQHLSDA